MQGSAASRFVLDAFRTSPIISLQSLPSSIARCVCRCLPACLPVHACVRSCIVCTCISSACSTNFVFDLSWCCVRFELVYKPCVPPTPRRHCLPRRERRRRPPPTGSECPLGDRLSPRGSAKAHPELGRRRSGFGSVPGRGPATALPRRPRLAGTSQQASS